MRTALRAAGAALLLLATGCHDAQEPPRAAAQVRHSDFVLEHMGRGGAVRRVVYEPPPELAWPPAALPTDEPPADPRVDDPAADGPGAAEADAEEADAEEAGAG
jgi:hypothetical protein